MKTFEAAEKALMAAALAYPETHEDNPWGHRVAKVRGKAFLFLGGDKDQDVLSLSVKLPETGGMALALPFAEPTGYGLGKSGWVSASFRAGQAVPVELLRAWLDESFRAVAPKTLVRAYLAQREAGPAPAAPAGTRAAKPVREPSAKEPAKRAARSAARAVKAPAKQATRKAPAKQAAKKAAPKASATGRPAAPRRATSARTRRT